MRKLQKPTDLPVDVFLDCISNYQDEALKNRLTSYCNEIKTASETFEKEIINTRLHTLAVQEEIEGVVNKTEMIAVYDNKFSKKGQPGRIYYDKLMAVPKLKKCPLCGYRIVSQLDHHLPKTKYPALAVTPINLIPACSDCNKIKTASKPSKTEEETLHPYFDDIENDPWLKAEVIVDNPVGIRFFVEKPFTWDDVKMKRVEHHFKLFKLGQLYSLYAAEELTLREYSLYKNFY